jgi:hypothetical protein
MSGKTILLSNDGRQQEDEKDANPQINGCLLNEAAAVISIQISATLTFSSNGCCHAVFEYAACGIPGHPGYGKGVFKDIIPWLHRC